MMSKHPRIAQDPGYLEQHLVRQDQYVVGSNYGQEKVAAKSASTAVSPDEDGSIEHNSHGRGR